MNDQLEPLVMWTIFDKPADFPDEVVCRRSVIRNGRIERDADISFRGASIDEVRKQLQDKNPGLFPVQIGPDNFATHAAEVWI